MRYLGKLIELRKYNIYRYIAELWEKTIPINEKTLNRSTENVSRIRRKCDKKGDVKDIRKTDKGETPENKRTRSNSTTEMQR